METFSALLAICAGNSPVPGEYPAQRPVRRSFDVFFDLRLNQKLSKQSWGWWFETLPRPLRRHCNDPYTQLIHDAQIWTEWWLYKQLCNNHELLLHVSYYIDDNDRSIEKLNNRTQSVKVQKKIQEICI